MMYTLNENIIIETFQNNESVAFDTSCENTYLLNESATYILQCFRDGPYSIEEVNTRYRDNYLEYNTDVEILNRDLETILHHFLINKIIVEVNE